MHKEIINDLKRNKQVFEYLFSGLAEKAYMWKSSPEKWCMLEIICHLFDEEREDFRARTKHVLEIPGTPMTPIDPASWVKDRAYINQNYSEKLNDFLEERKKSIEWLESLDNPRWDNSYAHPQLGSMSAMLFLSNWLAHDYLHIRQIVKLKFDYLKHITDEDLSYAGDW